MGNIILKPGLLVGLSTSISGGVKYSKSDKVGKEIDEAVKETGARITSEEAQVQAWETVKVVDDPEEYTRAVKVRGKCRAMITGVCVSSPFGLICPMSKENVLDEAIKESRSLAASTNETTTRSKIDIWCIKAQITESDTDALNGIASEIRNLLDQMQSGIAEMDVAKIRDAANKAKSLGGLLDGEAAGKVRAAVEEARKNAREIVRGVFDQAETAERSLVEIKTEAIREARFMFLDLEEPEALEGDKMSPVNSRALDVEFVANTVPCLKVPVSANAVSREVDETDERVENYVAEYNIAMSDSDIPTEF